MENRSKTIVRTSIIGIITNVLLASFKAAVGLLSNSIAIVLDAVNNLSDALSSVITIVGTKLAGRKPDKKHPLGHGRVEYLTAMVIAVLVIYAGITSLVESIKQIIHPETPEYKVVSLIIVAASVIVKILLGRYVKSVGNKVNSDSLVASGTDAMMDAIISASTLVAALIFIWKGLSLEAYLGALISLVIIKAGIDILRETISQIIGERVDSDLAKDIKKSICEFDDVSGAYDLILHSYGPDTLMGSVHIEIPDYYTADRIDTLTRRIQKKIFDKHGVILTAVSVYSMNTKDDEALKIKNEVMNIVMDHEGLIQVHGFYLDMEKKNMTFDMIIDFKANRDAVYNHILEEIKEKYPEYQVHIQLDSDISD
ncbi:MAG: cation transporter [Firmicutes bacterium]|nr:cation transporter [Bacillota bacterium]